MTLLSAAIADNTATNDIDGNLQQRLIAAIADNTATNDVGGASRVVSPYDFLPIAVADYDYTFDIKPHEVLPILGGKVQTIIKKDSGKVSIVTKSTQSTFGAKLKWTYMIAADYAILFDLYHNILKADGMENTFYWEHPVDGQIYVVRFLSELPITYYPGWTNNIEVTSIDFLLEGRKA